MADGVLVSPSEAGSFQLLKLYFYSRGAPCCGARLMQRGEGRCGSQHEEARLDHLPSRRRSQKASPCLAPISPRIVAPLPRLGSQSPQQHAEGQELLLRPRPPDVSLLISADWSQIGCGWGVLILAVPGARSQTVSRPGSHLRPFHTSQQLHRRSAEMGASLITLRRAKLRSGAQTDCARAFLTPFKVHLN